MTTRSAERLERLRYEAALRVARILRVTYATRRSRHRRTSSTGEEVFAKRNLVGAGLLRFGGNVLQRVEGTGAEFLGDDAWMSREAELARALGRACASVEDGTLLEPRVPGVDLASVLRSSEREVERRTLAFELSMSALRALHERGFTHADATCENVLVDGERAHWIDFETKHRANTEATFAKADDVRTLLFSSVWMAGGLAEELVRCGWDAYSDHALWRTLAEMRRVTSKSLVRVAQAPMEWDLYRDTWLAIEALSATIPGA